MNSCTKPTVRIREMAEKEHNNNNNNNNTKKSRKHKKTTSSMEEGSQKAEKLLQKMNRRGSTVEEASLEMVKEKQEKKNQSDHPAVVEGGSSEFAGKAGNSSSSRKRKTAYIYGNYRFYYGYRIDRNSKEDPRLLAFKKEWFQEKDCLDIGCNQGLITINIAKRFSCRSIVGVDIDGGLIEAANWTLRKMTKSEAASTRLVKRCKSEFVNGGPNSEKKVSQLTIEEDSQFFECSSPAKGCDLLKKVSFRKENFVGSLKESLGKYDTVLCLSVSKWIHLNWGDEGLITLFVKIWRILRPGGIFLFEPQPWQSYEKNHRVSETAKLNFRNIMFTPDLFEEILLDKIGFRSVENVTENLSGTVAGFERPIFVFTK